MESYVRLKPPTKGQKTTMGPGGKLDVPDNPIVLFIEGTFGPPRCASSTKNMDVVLEELGENMEKGSAGVGASSELIKLRRGCLRSTPLSISFADGVVA